ncbi:ADP/ATP translocase 4 [Dirofilaria immitis]|nr:ADP/ATP translocase 4 [Dirofilaria immitis]
MVVQHGDTIRHDYMPNTNDATKFLKDLALGASAAVVAKTIIAPIERVKLILQLQNAQKLSQLENVTRVCLIVSFEYQSNKESLGFAFKDFFKIWFLNGVDNKKDHWRLAAGNLGAGAASGVATYCIIYPLDFVRTRGFWPSIHYIFLYRGAYYGLFDTAKTQLIKHGNSDISFICAFSLARYRKFASDNMKEIVTFTAALISYPLDTVRRRFMMQAGRNDILYRGVWHCTTKIWYEEGFKAYFSGLWVNTIRGIGAALILAFTTNFLTKVEHICWDPSLSRRVELEETLAMVGNGSDV